MMLGCCAEEKVGVAKRVLFYKARSIFAQELRTLSLVGDHVFERNRHSGPILLS